MIDVTLQPDGTGFVSLPGRTIPVTADTLRDAREQAVGILTRYAVGQAAPLEVQALDAGEVVRFSVHPDGGIIVHRPGTEARATEPVGPSQMPAPMVSPEEFMTPTTAPTAPAAAVRLSPHTPDALHDGDRVQIGEQGFSVRLTSTPEP